MDEGKERLMIGLPFTINPEDGFDSLRIPPAERRPRNVINIQNLLKTLNVSFGGDKKDSQTKPALLKDLAACLIHAHCPAGEFVFRKHSVGEFFYIVLQGKLRLVFSDEQNVVYAESEELEVKIKFSVFKQVQDYLKFTKSTERTSLLEMATKRKSAFTRGSVLIPNQQSQQQATTGGGTAQVDHGEKYLLPGDSFGELAMMHYNSLRTCGVQAVENTVLGVVVRSHYMKILRR